MGLRRTARHYSPRARARPTLVAGWPAMQEVSSVCRGQASKATSSTPPAARGKETEAAVVCANSKTYGRRKERRGSSAGCQSCFSWQRLCLVPSHASPYSCMPQTCSSKVYIYSRCSGNEICGIACSLFPNATLQASFLVSATFTCVSFRDLIVSGMLGEMCSV